MPLKLFLSMVISCLVLQSSALATGEFFPGIDVSFYQGEIDFKELASSSYQSLYIRAGEGDDIVDSRFLENQKTAEEENLYYGFYYYVTAKNTSQAESQAEHFASLISGISYSLRPVLDFEDFSGLSIEESMEIALSFLEKLEELTGITPAIYTDAYEVETRWSSALSAYPLWVADYAHLANPEEYTLPENKVWTTWSGYQYTDSGIIPGITGNVDVDLFTSSLFIDKSDENSQNKPTTTLPSTFFLYTVKQGDTLWQISQIFHSTVELLAQDNNISNADLIYVGQSLKIPSHATYTVESGDTLSKIAFKFQISTEELGEINHIKNFNLIYVGEVLTIPTS